MRKLAVLATIALAGGVFASAANATTNVIDIYPGNAEGWGIPGAGPDGNFGGWAFGTTTRPKFVDGTTTSTTIVANYARSIASPGDGRGAMWLGNDGGAGDALLVTSENADGGNNLYEGVGFDQIAKMTFTHYVSSTNPNGSSHAGIAAGPDIILWHDGPGTAMSTEYLRMRSFYAQFWFSGLDYNPAGAAYPFDQWVSWEITPTDRVWEYAVNISGTTRAADIYDAATPFDRNGDTSINLDDLRCNTCSGDPDNAVLVSIQDVIDYANAGSQPVPAFGATGWPNSHSIEISNNIFGSQGDNWLDSVSFGFRQDGDTNWDSKVDLSDLSNLASNFGLTVTGGVEDGDFDASGDVNLSDLSTLAANWNLEGTIDVYNFTTGSGGSAPSGVGGTVPEPATLTLLGLGSLMVLSRRRRRA